MSLKGWLVSIILMPFTMGLSFYIYAAYRFWAWVGKFYIGMMKITLLLPVGILFFIVAKFFGYIFGSVEAVTSFFHSGLDNMKKKGQGGILPDIKYLPLNRYKLRYVVAFALVVMFEVQTFLPMIMSEAGSLLSLDMLPTLLLIPVPMIVLVLASGAMAKIFGNVTETMESAGRKAMGEGAAPVTETASAVRNAPEKAKGKAKGAARKASGAVDKFDDIEGKVETGKKAYDKAKGAKSIIQTAVNGTRLEGAIASVGGGGSLLTGGIIVVVVALIVWLIAAFIAVGISISLVVATWGYIQGVVGFLAGPIMSAIGLGGAYAQWFGQSSANQFAPQLDDAFEEERRAVAQLGARFGCMLKGPQCIREWRMNNTVRPGSEEVGETYELKIDQFGLGTNRIDAAYKEKGYTLPINFLVSNTRHGLKGITARDVKYRISVEGAGREGENAYCDTGWKSINTSTGNFILPGLGVSPTRTMEKLTLGNCGLLQPSLGTNRVLTMELKYNYSSQATLYFDAMSRQYRREKGIEPGFKKSQTAKTPVQSYINIKSPVTYFETENPAQPRRPVPFSARFGFETPGFDVEYKVHPRSVRIYDSSLTNVTSPADCRGLTGDTPRGGWDDDVYMMSRNAQERIEARQNVSWFNRNLDPAPLRCTMQIQENAVDSISPTGEQLIMRIDGNYTVKREDENAAFKVVNTRCTRENCPMLVTDQYNMTHEGLLYDTCNYETSVDSYDGCTVLVPNKPSDFRDDTRVGSQEGDIDWTDPQVAKQGGKEVILERGETAYKKETVVNWIENSNYQADQFEGFTTYPENIDSGIPRAVGLTDKEVSNIRNVGGNNFMLYKEMENDGRSSRIVYEELEEDYQACKGYINENAEKEKLWEEWKNRNIASEDAELLTYGMRTRGCSKAVKSAIDGLQCTLDLASEIPQTLTGWNALVEGGGLFGSTTSECNRIANKFGRAIKGCKGVVMYYPESESYQCWD